MAAGCALIGCAGSVQGLGSSSHRVDLTGGGNPPRAGNSLPLPEATARRLPAGVFYLLAGPNPLSCNVWEVSRSGKETELTHNRPNFGISSFGASRAGIVMADASTGADELVRLTAHGIVPLPGQHLGSPAINRRGEIAAVRPPGGTGTKAYFYLVVKKSFSAQPQRTYRQHTPLGGLAWGPHSSAATLSSPHPPGTTGPNAKLLVVGPSGHVRVLKTGFTNLSEVVWNERTPLLAVANWQGAGEIISLTGVRHKLPTGWWPAAWDAAGTRLLVRKNGSPGRLGLWSSQHPARVRIIGSVNSHKVISQVAWLASKSRM